MFVHRMFGGKDYNELSAGEKRADAESLRRSKILKAESLVQFPFSILKEEGKDYDHRPTKLTFANESQIELIYEIEDLTKRDTTWGDVWNDLYYDEETLAEMKYEAFVEQCNMAEGGDGDPISDDD